MDEALSNLIANLPIGIAILIIGWRMFSRMNDLDSKREDNRHREEQTRNDQITGLISALTTFNGAVISLRDMLDGKFTAIDEAVDVLTRTVAEQHQQTRQISEAAASDAQIAAQNSQVILEAVGRIENRIDTSTRTITGALDAMRAEVTRQGSSAEAAQDKLDVLATKALDGLGELAAYRAAIDEIRAAMIAPAVVAE